MSDVLNRPVKLMHGSHIFLLLFPLSIRVSGYRIPVSVNLIYGFTLIISFVPTFASRVTGHLSSLMGGVPRRIRALSPFRTER